MANTDHLQNTWQRLLTINSGSSRDVSRENIETLDIELYKIRKAENQKLLMLRSNMYGLMICQK